MQHPSLYSTILETIRASIALWRINNAKIVELRKAARREYGHALMNMSMTKQDELWVTCQNLFNECELVASGEGEPFEFRPPDLIIRNATWRVCLDSEELYPIGEQLVAEFTPPFLKLCKRKGIENL